MKNLLKPVSSIILAIIILSISCSKSNSSSSGNNSSSSLIPLSINNSWHYKLKHYNIETGNATDSSYFDLTIVDTFSANGSVFYRLQNSVTNTTALSIASINSNTLATIDTAFGVNYHTFFVNGRGDSLQSVASWPVAVTVNGSTCEGTNKLYPYYADTTLVNVDGIVYTNSLKNIIETYDCSGKKLYGNVYFVQPGTGLVRYVFYVHNAEGKAVPELAWVLESKSIN